MNKMCFIKMRESADIVAEALSSNYKPYFDTANQELIYFVMTDEHNKYSNFYVMAKDPNSVKIAVSKSYLFPPEEMKERLKKWTGRDEDFSDT